MTIESGHNNPEQLVDREASVPRLVIEDDVRGTERLFLEAVQTAVQSNPAAYLLDLRIYADRPLESIGAPTWHRLTEFGASTSLVGSFYFDRSTADLIKNDQKHRALHNGRGGDVAARGRAMRIRGLEIFLERLVETHAVGGLSIQNAA